MVRIKQKVSRAFRTRTGAETFYAFRCQISAVRKRGPNVIDATHHALFGSPFIPCAVGEAA